MASTSVEVIQRKILRAVEKEKTWLAPWSRPRERAALLLVQNKTIGIRIYKNKRYPLGMIEAKAYGETFTNRGLEVLFDSDSYLEGKVSGLVSPCVITEKLRRLASLISMGDESAYEEFLRESLRLGNFADFSSGNMRYQIRR